MNKQTAGIGMIITLIIGGAIGYVVKPSVDTSVTDKKLADAVVMMKEQSVAIKTMTDMMKSDGTMMQDLGAKYKDDTLMNMGKDMGMMSAKYMGEASTAENKGGMNQMMQ